MKNRLRLPMLAASSLLLGILFLTSCSKDDGPSKKEEEARPLVLTLSQTDIQERETVQFTVTSEGTAVDHATIYIDGTAIGNYEHIFAEIGTFKAIAKKEGYLDSTELIIEVSEELVDVYVAGHEFINGSDIATCWKNGERHHLTDGTYNASAYAIAVQDSDVYILVHDGYAIKYWKNDEEITVYEKIGGSASIGDMAVTENGDVYIAGDVWEGGKDVARYWKNDVFTDLAYNNNETYARGIAVSNDDVYVAGFTRSGSGVDDAAIALYWKNGVPVQLSDGNVPTYAWKIAVSGEDVHVVGESRDGGNWSPKYWRNGIEIPLSGGSRATDITIVDEEVYIAISGSWKMRYWQNGTQIEVGDAASAEGIAVYNGSVYTVGEIRNEANDTFAVAYWQNTSMFSLTDETYNSTARAITVVKRPN